MFDPKEHMPESRGPGDNYLDVAGRFMLAFVWIKPDESGSIFEESKNGNRFVHCKAVVIDGKPSGHRNEVFFDDVFLVPSTYKRLASMFRSMGYLERVNLDDERAVAHALLFRPFIAKVEVKKGDSKTFCKIAFTDEMDQDARKLADAWVASKADEYRERNAKASTSRTPGKSDKKAADFPDDDGPDFGDDDIPF